MISERHRLFLLCAETCHFTQAAERAFRTQSAVSQSMALLEEETGFLLFHRDGRRLRLTEAGRLLERYCREAAERERSLQVELGNLRQLSTGTVTLAAGSTLAGSWLPGPLGAFHRRWPGLRVNLMTAPTDQIVHWLAEGECDLGLVTLPVSEEQLRVRPLLEREDVLIAAPGSAHLIRRPPLWQDLHDAPFVLPDRSTRTRSFLDRQFLEAGVRPRVILEIRGFDFVKRYVEQDLGLSVVPRMAVEEELRRGVLEAWSLGGLGRRSVGLAVPARRALSNAAQALVSFLAPDSAATEPAPGPG